MGFKAGVCVGGQEYVKIGIWASRRESGCQGRGLETEKKRVQAAGKECWRQ